MSKRGTVRQGANGNQICFPLGSFGRGRVVPNEVMARTYARWENGSLLVVLILFALISGALIFYFPNFYLLYQIWALGGFLFMVRGVALNWATSGWVRTDERALSSVSDKSLKRIIAFWLCMIPLTLGLVILDHMRHRVGVSDVIIISFAVIPLHIAFYAREVLIRRREAGQV